MNGLGGAALRPCSARDKALEKSEREIEKKD